MFFLNLTPFFIPFSFRPDSVLVLFLERYSKAWLDKSALQDFCTSLLSYCRETFNSASGLKPLFPRLMRLAAVLFDEVAYNGFFDDKKFRKEAEVGESSYLFGFTSDEVTNSRFLKKIILIFPLGCLPTACRSLYLDWWKSFWSKYLEERRIVRYFGFSRKL